MAPREEGLYLPREASPIKAWWFRLYLSLALRTWRRELARFIRQRGRGRSLRLLDCGCGPGFLLCVFEKAFRDLRLVGMDLDRLVLQYARTQTHRTTFVRASASQASLPMADRSFDVMMALHVVEHLEDPDAFLRDARRILVPGGMIMLATPNPEGLGARMMGRKWMGHRDDHISLRSPDAWRGAVRAAGFTITREGTTGLAGIPVFRQLPLGVLNWVPLVIWGFFPWMKGEAYICLARAA